MRWDITTGRGRHLAFGIIATTMCCILEMTSDVLVSSQQHQVSDLSCVTSLKPQTKFVHTLDLYASQHIKDSVKCATCRELCDSSPEWERLPLFQPVDAISNSPMFEVSGVMADYDYLKSLRVEHGWNTTAWDAHDRRQSECNFVCAIPHGFIDGLGLVCAVNDGVCCIQQDCMNRAPDLPPDLSRLPRYDKVLVISQEWGHAMYHGILECAIKLGDVLSMLQADESIHIHVPEHHGMVGILFPPILADLGIDQSRILSGQLIAKQVIAPRATRCMEPSTRQLLKFRQVIENTDCYRKYDSRSPSSGIMLIKRQRGAARSFVNHEELKNALGEFATTRSVVFDEYDAPDHPFEGRPRNACAIIRDMLRFKQSKVIVAAHGAGLTNIILCNPGTIIVETHTANVNYVYTSISMRLGLRHLSLFDVKSNHYTPTTSNVSAIVRTLTALT